MSRATFNQWIGRELAFAGIGGCISDGSAAALALLVPSPVSSLGSKPESEEPMISESRRQQRWRQRRRQILRLRRRHLERKLLMRLRRSAAILEKLYARLSVVSLLAHPDRTSCNNFPSSSLPLS